MTARLAQIWRHPIKGHGAEERGEVMLAAGRNLPRDRECGPAQETGMRDAHRLGAPDRQRGHEDPGVCADRATGGRMAVGDGVDRL